MIWKSPPTTTPPRYWVTGFILLLCLFPILSGCARIMASAVGGLTHDLSQGILNQDDPQIVADGAPSYLLLMDGMLQDNTKNPDLYLAGAQLYNAYSSVFVKQPERAKRMSTKARDYARRAWCLRLPKACDKVESPHAEFVPVLAQLNKKDVDLLYTFASTWVSWIQANSSDWNAIADLAKVQACMQRVVELDETHDHGGAHLYLGVLNTLLPPALGGKPDIARQHFERAIALSNGRNLMAKVQYAERYARLVFDRELHDSLLRQVLEADAKEPGLTLINTIAKEQARSLQQSAADYF